MLLLIQYEESQFISHLHQSTCSLSLWRQAMSAVAVSMLIFNLLSPPKIQKFIQQLYFNVTKTYIQTMIQCCTWTPFKKTIPRIIGHAQPHATQFSLNPAPDRAQGGWRVPSEGEVRGASWLSAFVWMTSAPSLMCIYSIRLNYTGSSNTPSARG